MTSHAKRVHVPIIRGVLAALWIVGGAAHAGHASDDADALEQALPPPSPGFVPQASPPPDGITEQQRLLAYASIAAGSDRDIHYPNWCFNGPPPPELSDRTQVGPVRLFDDFYYLGMVTVGQFALKTKDGGFVLFDTLDNASEVQSITLPKLQQIGLDPATQLRAIILTHGHSDHDGGAAYLQQLSGAPVYEGSADYTAAKAYDVNGDGLIDSSDLDARELSIAGSLFIVLPTPGHTNGTTSFVIPVKYQGHQYRVAYWGGSGVTSNSQGPDYMRSAERMYTIINALGVEASVNSHTFFDASDDRMAQIVANGGIARSNPMIQGGEKIKQSFTVLRNCAATKYAALDPAVQIPAWRITKTNLYAVKVVGERQHPTHTLGVAAQLSNAFGVIKGQVVSFEVGGGSSCSALTDENGVARCLLRASVRPGNNDVRVAARYAGRPMHRDVDLPSVDSVSLDLTKSVSY